VSQFARAYRAELVRLIRRCSCSFCFEVAANHAVLSALNVCFAGWVGGSVATGVGSSDRHARVTCMPAPLTSVHDENC